MVGLKAEENWLFSVDDGELVGYGGTAGVDERTDLARRTSLAVYIAIYQLRVALAC